MQIYAGNILWSILSALHAFGKSDLKLLTYSDVWTMDANDETEAEMQKRMQSEVEEVREKAWAMLNKFQQN